MVYTRFTSPLLGPFGGGLGAAYSKVFRRFFTAMHRLRYRNLCKLIKPQESITQSIQNIISTSLFIFCILTHHIHVSVTSLFNTPSNQKYKTLHFIKLHHNTSQKKEQKRKKEKEVGNRSVVRTTKRMQKVWPLL